MTKKVHFEMTPIDASKAYDTSPAAQVCPECAARRRSVFGAADATCKKHRVPPAPEQFGTDFGGSYEAVGIPAAPAQKPRSPLQPARVGPATEEIDMDKMMKEIIEPPAAPAPAAPEPRCQHCGGEFEYVMPSDIPRGSMCRACLAKGHLGSKEQGTCPVCATVPAAEAASPPPYERIWIDKRAFVNIEPPSWSKASEGWWYVPASRPAPEETRDVIERIWVRGDAKFWQAFGPHNRKDGDIPFVPEFPRPAPEQARELLPCRECGAPPFWLPSEGEGWLAIDHLANCQRVAKTPPLRQLVYLSRLAAPLSPTEQARLAEKAAENIFARYDRVGQQAKDEAVFFILEALQRAPQGDFRAGVAAERPKIICLCGSTRFVDTWINEYQRLSDEGNIVLTVARMPPRPNLQHDEPELKQRLDELHKRKIDLADEVYVLDVDGYIGDSTRGEIEYAKASNKPIKYLSADSATSPPAQQEVNEGEPHEFQGPSKSMRCACGLIYSASVHHQKGND